METYLHKHSFFVSFDLFVVNHHNCIDYTFGSIRVEMPFSGINRFCIRTSTEMNIFDIFLANLLFNVKPPISSCRQRHFSSYFFVRIKIVGFIFFVNYLKMVLVSNAVAVYVTV